MALSDALYAFHYHFKKATNAEPANRAGVDALVDDLLVRNRGLGFGEYHGGYCYPMYLEERAKDFFGKGMHVLVVEFIQKNRQHLLDQWQTRGDASGLIAYMNNRTYANSSYQWEHYWKLLQSAKRAGMHLYGCGYTLDPNETVQKYPMEKANDAWVHTIRSAMAHRGDGVKFGIFGGRAHFRYMDGGVEGVNYRLDFPAVHMEMGPYRVLRNAVSRLEHIIQIPHAPHHVSFFPGPVVPHRRIEYVPGRD